MYDLKQVDIPESSANASVAYKAEFCGFEEDTVYKQNCPVAA